MNIEDTGPQPLVVDIEDATIQNNVFRRALWTGNHFQITLMTIPVGGEVGLEVHDDTDQFLRIEAGQAQVLMGPTRDSLDQSWEAADDWAIVVPSGTWHNIVNTGEDELKVYSIYAPPHHPHGTVHATKLEADAAEQLD